MRSCLNHTSFWYTIPMRRVIVILLVFLSLVVLFLRFAYKPLTENLGIKPRAGLRVEASLPAQVFLGDKNIGKTPLQSENLVEGEYLISLVSEKGVGEASSSAALGWKGYVKLAGGTLSIVNRDLGVDIAASSGEVITLDEGEGITVVSTPSGSDVVLDGQGVGRTPVSVSKVSSGEHQLMVRKDTYISRSSRVNVVDGYNLTWTVDLARSESDLTKLPTLPTLTTNQLIVKATPTGFLRLRKSASTASLEVGRVATGEMLTLVEELEGWYKVKTAEGLEGFVSSLYVEKKSTN